MKRYSLGKLYIKMTRFVAIALLAAFINVASFSYIAYGLDQLPIFLDKNQQTPAALMLEGQDFYSNGRYFEASNNWQQASQLFLQQGDIDNYASALSNLSLAQIQLGQYMEADTNLSNAQSQLDRAVISPYHERIQAQVLSAYGQFYQKQGLFLEALGAYELATEKYQAISDISGIIQAQLNRAQLLQNQGLYIKSQELLKSIESTLQELPASTLKVTGLRQLGNILRLTGEKQRAGEILQSSLNTAQSIGSDVDASATFLSLGNLYENYYESQEADQINYYNAQQAYQEAIDKAPTVVLRLQAKVNLLRLSIDAQEKGISRSDDIQSLLNDIFTELEELPPGRAGDFIRINLADTLMHGETSWTSDGEIFQLLEITLNHARDMGDQQIETYALGYLGHLYERRERWSDAIKITQNALLTSEAVQADVATYQWYWQLGRILTAQGNKEFAISAYKEAITILQNIQGDLISANPDTRFLFIEEVEPLYRNLVSLLLNEPDVTQTPPENLKQAQETIEALQTSELINFFQADCIEANPQNIGQIATVDNTAALIYPILLSDRLEMILSLPGQPLIRVSTSVKKSEVAEVIRNLQKQISLRPLQSDKHLLKANIVPQGAVSDRSNYEKLSQKLYEWIINPIESYLTSVETLVFVLDGPLRSIPMSVLYDGSHYLIENYAVATTPGLQLFDKPEILTKDNLSALIGGLSQGVSVKDSSGTVLDFSDLKYVEQEIDSIQKQVNSSEVLLNENFIKSSFRDRLNELPFPIVHLATHGQFGEDLESTFVITHDGKINANEFSAWLQFGEANRNAPIELLILSACETATGNNQTVLGLAGIAVRSGARSTLATLWQVDDEATAFFMEDFYRQLANKSQSKVKSLQQAQIQLLKDDIYQDPYYWAPFVLIGNWL